jgi:hypothetical protein
LKRTVRVTLATTQRFKDRAMINGTVSAAAAILLAASLPAAAADFQNSSVTPRQLVHCMMKRMRADRTQSYRAVFKACRQDLLAAQPARADDTAMNNGTAARDPAAPKQ